MSGSLHYRRINEPSIYCLILLGMMKMQYEKNANDNQKPLQDYQCSKMYRSRIIKILKENMVGV